MGLGKEQLAQRKGWGRPRPLAGMEARHADSLQEQRNSDPSTWLFEGPGTVSALSPWQYSCPCQVSETTENLNGGEAEKKLQGPGQH